MRVAPALWLVAALLAGCGSAPERMTPVRAQAVDANARGHAAFDRGDTERATRFFRQALALERSIERNDGIAANLLALARVEQATGANARALERLDELVGAGGERYPANLRAEAAGRQAVLHLAANDTAAAAARVARALEFCGTACAARAAIVNLDARVRLATGDARGALAAAAAARTLAADRAQPAEEANGLRLSAQAHLALGEPAAAVPLLQDALALDHRLGLPPRIHADLLRLADAESALGNRPAAIRYAERAVAVSEAAGDAAGVHEARMLLEALR
jgi:tetratricopeptide (TPR) repeat protein